MNSYCAQRKGQTRIKITLVQQGVWETPLESMPLASGYLKAATLADARLRNQVEIDIVNFRGGTSIPEMAKTLFSRNIPDVIGFSVAGWNFQQFGALSETFRQLNPSGWLVMGGTHVANQGARLFRLFPWVDVVVDGEGEEVFADLIAVYLSGGFKDLSTVAGITYRNSDGEIAVNGARSRIQDLDKIPSPFLTEAIPMLDRSGCFAYDVALMETSRGCPYKCAFCYWGGATGQKMRAFSRERLKEELEFFAYHRVGTIVLCDSNFGMRPADADFLEDFIQTRERHGFPRSLETSWAKNKSEVFREIVRQMKTAGLTSSFTLALQSLNEEALEMMKRRNMRLNDWEELVEWLRSEGLDCYAEMIWGAPGETPSSFLDGYDRLAEHVPRIAPYPLLLLPNTHYSESRDSYGFITVRGREDDFEYVLAHDGLTMEENQQMQRFLFWARVAAENLVFRRIWQFLRRFGGVRQSVALLSLADWFDERPRVEALCASKVNLGDPDSIPRALRALYANEEIDGLLGQWWDEVMLPLVPLEIHQFATDVFRYDLFTRPIFDEPGFDSSQFRLVEVDGEPHYIGGSRPFTYHPDLIVQHTMLHPESELEPPAPSPCQVRFSYRSGFHLHLANHEMAVHYVGKPFEVRVVTAPRGESSFRSATAAEGAMASTFLEREL